VAKTDLNVVGDSVEQIGGKRGRLPEAVVAGVDEQEQPRREQSARRLNAAANGARPIGCPLAGGTSLLPSVTSARVVASNARSIENAAARLIPNRPMVSSSRPKGPCQHS
jgi:hypothetical protein